MRGLCPPFYGATYEKMEGTGHAQWPIPNCRYPGTPDMYLGRGKFTTPDNRANLMAHTWEPPTELPATRSTHHPVHGARGGALPCRSMTGNCRALSLLAEEPGELHIHPSDAQARGIRDGELLRARVLAPRRGHEPRGDEHQRGTVYMTYQWWIGKCNNLTLHAVDPRSHTPEDKFSACQVVAIEDQAEQHLQELYEALK